jgi:hypothetical protein
MVFCRLAALCARLMFRFAARTCFIDAMPITSIHATISLFLPTH